MNARNKTEVSTTECRGKMSGFIFFISYVQPDDGFLNI